MNHVKFLLIIVPLIPASASLSMSYPTKPYLNFLKAYSNHHVCTDEILKIYQDATANPEDKESIDKLVLGTHFDDTYNNYLQALLETKKIDLNAYRFENSRTALMQTVFYQYPHKVSLLLLYGAAIEAQDCNGKTAIDNLNSQNNINRGSEIKEQIQKMLQDAHEKAQPRLLKKALKELEITRLSSYLTSHPYTLETVLPYVPKNSKK
jgi:ankyrin repeat protein